MSQLHEDTAFRARKPFARFPKTGIALCAFLVLFSYIGSGAQTTRIDSLKKDAILLEGDTGQVWTYIRLGLNFKSISYDSTLHYMRLSNQAARKTNFIKGITASHTRLGNTFWMMTQLDSAQKHYEIAMKVYQESGDSMKQAVIYNNLGLISQSRGHYSKSIRYYMKALKIKESMGDRKSVASTSHNIGIVFALQEDYAKAEKYMQVALDILLESGDSMVFYGVVGDYAQLLYEKQDYDRALYWVNRSLNFFSRTNYTIGTARNEITKGLLMVARGDYNNAINHYLMARTLYQEIGDRNWVSTCNLYLSRAAYLQGRYAKSVAYGEESLKVAKEIDSKGNLASIYEQLSKSHAALSNYQLAYEYKVRHMEISDSLLDQEKQRAILEVEGKYNEEKQQREIEELKSEKALESLIKKRRETQTYILVGVLVLTLFVGGLFVYQYRVKQRRNIILQEKNTIIENSLKEKEVLLREIHHRVQNNLQFVSSLLNLQSRHIDDEKTVQLLKECRTRIQSMAMIHQKLYQEKSLKGINIDNYINNLIETISGSYSVDKDQIEVITEVDPIELDINTAIPIGLILNELITNAFKYAFENRESGRLLIRLRQRDGKLLLTVQDDGIGLPEDYDHDGSGSFGMKLVRSLAAKMKADIEVTGGIGTTVHLAISDYEVVT